MINDTIDPFINAYRDSLDRQKDLTNQNLANQRRNQFQSIMAGANKLGMMYSNFPERQKIQYDTSTYTPALTKVQNNYQTGLDKLRSNTVNLVNQLRSINEAIADLNSSGSGGGNSSKSKSASSPYNKWDYGNGYAVYALPGGEAIYTKDDKKISAGNFLENAPQNWDNWNDIWNNTSTKYYTNGVGSDTVDAYYTGKANRDNPDYGYLYK